jgi:hypothetical protein
MITINLLKKHPNAIPALAHIWHKVLGKIWFLGLCNNAIFYGILGDISQDSYDQRNQSYHGCTRDSRSL